MLNKIVKYNMLQKLLLLPIILTLFIVTSTTIFLPTNIYAETNIPTKPENGIYDPQHYLSKEVENKLSQHNETSDTPIGIYIVDSLNSYPIEDISNEVARKWKIGYKDVDKGVLIVIAIKDRRFRIETSDEVAVHLTDGESKSILNDTSKYMKQQHYSEGVINLIDRVQQELSVDAQSKPFHNSKRQKKVLVKMILLLTLAMCCFAYTIKQKKYYSNKYDSRNYFGSSFLSFIVDILDTSSDNDSNNNNWSGGGFGGGGASGGW